MSCCFTYINENIYYFMKIIYNEQKNDTVGKVGRDISENRNFCHFPITDGLIRQKLAKFE